METSNPLTMTSAVVKWKSWPDRTFMSGDAERASTT